MQRRITYEGSEFTIEWYCDSKGHSQALKYFEEQPKDKQRKLLNLIVIYVFSSKERKLL